MSSSILTVLVRSGISLNCPQNESEYTEISFLKSEKRLLSTTECVSLMLDKCNCIDQSQTPKCSNLVVEFREAFLGSAVVENN